MKRTIQYLINSQNNQKTIGQYLKEEGYSHQVIVNLKKTTNGILLNNTWSYVTTRMQEGDVLSINIEENTSSDNIDPIYIPFEIVYEDEDLLLINKPANMPIHPSMGNHDNTLANALAYYFLSKEESFTFRCINRLDRDTTGLTIIAKHNLSAAILGRQVANRQIHRTYTAICHGKLPDTGIITAPIGRVSTSTIERCVDFEAGESAITHYTRLDYNPALDLSLAKLQLETGRTHQIRVHMKYIGHPLIGDFLYYPDMNHIKRQALHSSSISFIHPITKEKMHFHIPLPRDMECIFPSV